MAVTVRIPTTLRPLSGGASTVDVAPGSLLDVISARKDTVPDQWQVQVQAKIQVQADVVVRSDYLDADALRSAHLGHTDDVTATVEAALAAAGPDARVCVLPEGPQTIPYVAS